jgi:class 3 adenylate cyclase/tetratricopeptide (TPR) repeat protein
LFCGNCGAENRDGQRFCTSCGTEMGAKCPGCGSLLIAGDVFCGSCGTPVAGPAMAPTVGAADRTRETPGPPVVFERRLVSVLFVDLVGFTTFSEGRDPEDVREMLGRYFGRAEEIIGSYGGVVEKFIGDAVMAVWGTPVAREDDAGRAVRAALELIGSVDALGRSLQAELQARGGIFTGEAAVNLEAKGQGMVAGDTVNTASRLQSSASPGSVLVDRATYLGARDAVAFEPAGQVALKGKEGPVEAWRPLRVTAHLGGFRPADSLEPAFTGREEEFRLVKDLLHATSRERKPRIASIVGVGGIGKSRLVWELYKHVDGLSNEHAWHQGRSPSYGEGVAFWALSEMVRMRSGIAETDDDDATSAKIDDCLATYFTDDEERKWLKPHLAHLIGLEERADVDREQLFAAWRVFFEKIAEVATVIMIFEDLHWADSGLVDFIEYLMEWSRNSPILILTLARPELMDRRPTWGAGQRNFTSVHLEPLQADDMTLLLKSLVPDLPEGVRQEITDRAEGVPLYGVEMVRMLIDREALVPGGDGYRWAGEAASIDVPDSLHALIASRLDSLAPENRHLAQDASILGKTFTIASLSVVANTPSTELEDRLLDLVRREILFVDNDPRSPERGQYGFVQSLIREVAYGTLSNQNRMERHIAAAEYFASTGEQDVIDVVATHFMEAYNNSRKDADASVLADRARSALVEAAERSRSLGSSAQCLALLEKALMITTEASKRGELLYRAGWAAISGGKTNAGIEYLLEAIELLRQTEDRALLVQAQAQLGFGYFVQSDVDRAVETLEGAVQQIDDSNSPEAALLHMELARFYMLKGMWAESELNVALGMPAAERTQNVSVVAEGLITRGTAAAVAGRTLEAHATMNGALQLCEEHGLVAAKIRGLNNLAESQLRTDPRTSYANAAAGYRVAQRYANRTYEGGLLASAIAAATHLGEWNWYRETMADVPDDVLEEMGSIVLPPICIMEAYRGNLEEAHRFLERFERVVANSSFMQDAMALAGCHCTIALMEDRPKDAEAAAATLRKAALTLESEYDLFIAPFGSAGRSALWARNVEAARSVLAAEAETNIQTRWHDCRVATLKAGIAALEGSDEAVALYEETIRTWESLDVPMGKALCQTDFALLVGGRDAREAIEEAVGFWRGAGNQVLVRRIESARGL